MRALLVPLILFVALHLYADYKGRKTAIGSESAYEACWNVCYEQQITTIRAAFDAGVLKNQKAQELLYMMQETCQTECKDRLGIE